MPHRCGDSWHGHVYLQNCPDPPRVLEPLPGVSCLVSAVGVSVAFICPHRGWKHPGSRPSLTSGDSPLPGTALQCRAGLRDISAFAVPSCPDRREGRRVFVCPSSCAEAAHAGPPENLHPAGEQTSASLPPEPAHSVCLPAHPHPLGAVNPELSQTWGCFQVALHHLLGEVVAEQSSHPILTRRLASPLGPLTSPAPTPLLHGFTLHLLGAQLLQDLSQVFLLLEASSISTLGRGLSPWDRVALVCLLTSLLACPLPSAQRGVIIRAFQGLEWNLLTTGLFKTQIYSK